MYQIKRSAVALAVALSIGATAPALANNTNGSIQGTSVQVNGNSLSNVTITIENLDTGLTRSVQSDESGNFRFPLLPAGNYKVTAEKNGFRTTIQESVKVGISGKTNLDMRLASDDVERIEVTGTTIAMVDVTSSSTGIVVDSVTLDRVPVPRNLTSVALLAPGTTQGDSAFGDLPSIGGASVGENGYYINGLNITNFRTGVGSSEPPFDMYETFEVKTGGYSAEFGRVTGGVINAKTKSGTNEFKAGANFYWEPDALREQRDSSRNNVNGLYRIDNTQDEVDEWDVNVWASGALIEDKLFFYALFNPRSAENNYAGEQTSTAEGVLQNGYFEKDDDAFWVAKLDWYVTENNILEITAFSDERSTKITTYDSVDGGNYTDGRVGYEDEGGLNYTAKWTSIINDDFSISAQYGINILSRHLNKKINLMGTIGEKKRFLEEPEVVEASKQLFQNEDGSDRFYIVEDRDGDLESIKELISNLIISCDCRVIVLDPISDILEGCTNEEQQSFYKWMKGMLKSHLVTFINIAHVRKSSGGQKANSTGADLHEEDFFGSSSLFKSSACNLLFMRDKESDDEIMRNTTRMKASKIRWTGRTSPVAGEYYYDIDKHTLYDKQWYAENIGFGDIPKSKKETKKITKPVKVEPTKVEPTKVVKEES